MIDIRLLTHRDMMIMMITMMMCYMTICVLKSWLEANLLANSTIIIKTDVRENKKKQKAGDDTAA